MGGQNGGGREGRDRESNTLTFSLLSITVPSTGSLPVGIWVSIN